MIIAVQRTLYLNNFSNLVAIWIWSATLYSHIKWEITEIVLYGCCQKLWPKKKHKKNNEGTRSKWFLYHEICIRPNLLLFYWKFLIKILISCNYFVDNIIFILSNSINNNFNVILMQSSPCSFFLVFSLILPLSFYMCIKLFLCFCLFVCVYIQSQFEILSHIAHNRTLCLAIIFSEPEIYFTTFSQTLCIS